MFSLSDEMEKFEKQILLFPKGLLTIDEKFLGGGIKMQDLIQENSFIISEMRRFNEVFLNYCKLNDKVYKKIIEHEMHANEHLSKIASISAHIDRRLDHSDHELKNLKQELSNNMTMLIEKNEKDVVSIRDSISKKVDEEGFTDKINTIIKIYEEEPEEEEDENEGEPMIAISNSTLRESNNKFSMKRKGKNINSEDMENFKAEINPIIESIEEQIKNQNMEFRDFSEVIEKMEAKNRKWEQDTKWISDDICDIRKDLMEMKTDARLESKRIIEMIEEKSSDNIWSEKLKRFKEKFIDVSISELYEEVTSKIGENSMEVSYMGNRIKEIEESIISNNQRYLVEQSLRIKNENQISHLETVQHKAHENIMKDIQEMKIKNEQNLAVDQQHRKQEIAKLEKNIKIIERTIEEVGTTTEQIVLEKCQIRIDKTMREIRIDIVNLSKKTSELNTNVKSYEEKIGYVRDLVASKANYSDLVLYFDKKADKQDMKELQELVVESPVATQSAIFEESFRNESQVLRKKSDEKRKKLSWPKRMSTPISKVEEESSKHLSKFAESFSMIREGTKVSYRTNQKNKTMRPSTATTLFLL